jgi:serine/threonine-protein kinase RIM15
MVESGQDNGKLLAPPSFTALKNEETNREKPGRMARTISSDIREEREDLKEAAEQTSNVILDLGLDGIIRWVSPSWQEVIGTTPDSVQGKAIADLLLEDKDTFANAVESIKKDDSKSHMVKFPVHVGPLSRYAPETAKEDEDNEIRKEDVLQQSSEPHTILLEGQGIMVYDRGSGGESHVSVKTGEFLHLLTTII